MRTNLHPRVCPWTRRRPGRLQAHPLESVFSTAPRSRAAGHRVTRGSLRNSALVHAAAPVHPHASEGGPSCAQPLQRLFSAAVRRRPCCVRWLVGVLVCVSLVAGDVERLPRACWPPVCFLERNVYLSLLPVFRLGCFCVTESCELFADIWELKPHQPHCLEILPRSLQPASSFCCFLSSGI